MKNNFHRLLSVTMIVFILFCCCAAPPPPAQDKRIDLQKKNANNAQQELSQEVTKLK
jgi:hypothetical protein